MSAASTRPEDRKLTIDDLVSVARAAGADDATRRTIHHWRGHELVGTPNRQGKAWLYPRVCAAQVRTIVRWRRKNAPLELIRFAIFVETGSIDLELARQTALGFLTLWREGVEEQRERFVGAPGELEREAARAARMRGTRSPLPRRVRMRPNNRELALVFAFARMLDVTLSPDIAGAGAFQLERLLGLRSGRGGAQRDITKLIGDDSDVAEIPAPELLVEAARTGTPARIELARRGVEATVLWMPAGLPVIASELGPAFSPFVDIVRDWARQVGPDVYVVLFATMLMNNQQKASEAEVEWALRVFDPARAAAELLRQRPESELALVRRRLPDHQREALDHELTSPQRGQVSGSPCPTV